MSAALLRELKILWYRWAERSMEPLHPELPEVVHRLNELRRERPTRANEADLTRACDQRRGDR